jgi:ABC-2 type transport system ATP-binding protein
MRCILSNMSAIETHNLTKSYVARRGIRDIGLSVNPGEIFGFLGPNGAGKSTTIRLLLGFLKASSGSATIFGHDCWTDSTAARQKVGYVSGDVRLYPWLTLDRALHFVGLVRRTDIRPYGLELAERFQLERRLPVGKMSKGNRQKLGLILALAHRPQLAILDEPTSGLDPLMQDVLAECMREMADAGRTVFFSSHTLSEVETLCERVAIVRDGGIAACEDLETLRNQAPRVIRITFDSKKAAASVEWPDFVRLQHHRDQVCELHLDGPAAKFIAWASRQPIVDMSISRPNLETVFRRFYTDSQQPGEV